MIADEEYLKLLVKESKEYLNHDITRLLFSPHKDLKVDVKHLADQIRSRKKALNKFENEFLDAELFLPPPSSIEQASSSIAANHKSQYVEGHRMVDLTAGFGVDSIYFSKKARHVLAVEKDKTLSEILNYNIKILELNNIHVVHDDSMHFLETVDEVYDTIYIDPLRRTEDGQRLYSLNQCEPNIIPKIEGILKKAKQVIIKASPMLDITQGIKELQFVTRIDVVAIKNEVKELLFFLEPDLFSTQEGIKITSFNYTTPTEVFSFNFNTNSPVKVGNIGSYIFDPNAAIRKSNGVDALSRDLKLNKLGRSNPLLSGNDPIDNFPGRMFEVVEIYEQSFNQIKKKLRGSRFNILVRDYPIKSNDLLKNLNIKSENEEDYLIFTTERGAPKIICAKKVK